MTCTHRVKPMPHRADACPPGGCPPKRVDACDSKQRTETPRAYRSSGDILTPARETEDEKMRLRLSGR